MESNLLVSLDVHHESSPRLENAVGTATEKSSEVAVPTLRILWSHDLAATMMGAKHVEHAGFQQLLIKVHCS